MINNDIYTKYDPKHQNVYRTLVPISSSSIYGTPKISLYKLNFVDPPLHSSLYLLFNFNSTYEDIRSNVYVTTMLKNLTLVYINRKNTSLNYELDFPSSTENPHSIYKSLCLSD